MSERAVAELIVHLGRITPRGRLRRGPDAGAMNRAALLWARQPLLPDALRLRGISWHGPVARLRRGAKQTTVWQLHVL